MTNKPDSNVIRSLVLYIESGQVKLSFVRDIGYAYSSQEKKYDFGRGAKRITN
jgi:hypothetical protein